MSDEQTNTNFTWNPLGEKWWRAAAESCTHKPTEAQLRFAAARHDGLTAVDAARRAGYSGSGEQIRGAGSRALKSTSVQELLAYAHAETGTGDDGVVKDGEARRLLSRIARTGDNNSRIKALESLSKMERDQRDRLAASGREPTWDESAVEILATAGEMGVGVVAVLALAHGLDISYSPLKEIAPHIRANWPDIWQKMIVHIGRINPDTKLKWIEYGDGPLVDLNKFAKSAPKGNGASRPTIEPEGAADAAA